MLKEKKSLSQIQKWQWKGNIPTVDNSSYEEYNFYVLHKKPLNKYTIKDVYFMLVQDELLEILIPYTLDFLDNKDVFFEAEYYEGDLFNAILSNKCEFWKSDFAKRYIPKLIRLINKFENYDYTEKKIYAVSRNTLKNSIDEIKRCLNL